MKPRRPDFDVIVVGGGAAGLIAAGRAAERGLSVLLLEKNKELGKKLSISGGGRCNVTNAESDEHTLLRAYGAAEPFLYSLFSQFGVKDTFSFFESRGLPLVVQARNRAFPKTEKAQDVVRVLETYIKKEKATIIVGTPVLTVVTDGKRITGVTTAGQTYRAKDYIFATGSVSHPETGSTGDGFPWLRALGHTVAKPTPTIVPLAVKESWVKMLAGVSLPYMKITFFVEGTKAFSKKGELLFTHFGVSGPLILNSASAVADLLHTGQVTATIDVFPDTDLGELERTIIAVFDANKNKTLKNVIGECVPAGMSKGIIALIAPQVNIEQKVHSVSREDRKYFVSTLKALPLTIKGLLGFDRAVIADGGVPLKEIDMRTMCSNIVPNLYIIGDLLHVNRPSGGFSLQLCWSSGYVAGTHVGA